MPEVSVVIPAFNVARYVDDCIASVRAQSLSDWECIVVDDGSTDTTAARVAQQSDPRVRLIRQSNRGASAARNAGLAHARGRYLLFLDGDDRLHPQALARLAASLDAEPGAVAAYGTVRLLLDDGRPYPRMPQRRHRFRSGDLLASVVRGEIFLLMGSTLVRTLAARELGGFNAGLRLSEDWEFWCRLAARGSIRFCGAECEVSYVRVRPASSSRRLAHAWDNHQPAIEAVVSNPALASKFERDGWRRLTREALAFHLWEAGRVNFTARRYAEARRLMLRSLGARITAKRLALFAIAQASQALGVSLVPRLRFVDDESR